MKMGSLAATSLAAMAVSIAACADDMPAKGKDPTAGLQPAEPAVMDVSRVFQGFTYYNKPGADMATQAADLKYCRSIAVLGVQPHEGTASIAGGVIGYLLTTAVITVEANRGVAANIEDCMIVRGWRVVQISDSEGGMLTKLDQASLSAQLGVWVGGDPPHGQIVRLWDNDMAKGKTIKFREAGAISHRSLSVLALAKDLDAPATRPPPGPQPPKSALQPRALNAAHISGIVLGPDEAMVIVRLRNPGVETGAYLEFERLGPDPNTPAWYADQRPFDVTTGKTYWQAKKEGDDYAFVVPAGAWRLASMMGGLFTTINFCFGAPAFAIKEGEVIYAGAFDFAADDIGPDMDLAPVKPFLVKAPLLAAKLRAADWVNGYASLCRGTYFYDYEIKGAPMRDGYVRGNAPLAKGKTDSPGAGSPTPSH